MIKLNGVTSKWIEVEKETVRTKQKKYQMIGALQLSFRNSE